MTIAARLRTCHPRTLIGVWALLYMLILGLYGCGVALRTSADANGCHDEAAVFPEQSTETLDCDPTATKILTLADGWAFHVCKCPGTKGPKRQGLTSAETRR